MFHHPARLSCRLQQAPTQHESQGDGVCKEGISQRLWGLMCSLPGSSIFCPSVQPAAEMLGRALRLIVISRLSIMQVRAGGLQVPPALVISCCTSVQQGALTLGDGWVRVLGAACPPRGRADGEGVSRHHPGRQDNAAAREPCRRGGCSSSKPRRVLACMPRCSLPRAALAAAPSHHRHFNESWAEPGLSQPPQLPRALAGQRVSSTGTGAKLLGEAAGCRKTSGSCLGSHSLNSSGCCSPTLIIAAMMGGCKTHL